MRVIIVDSLIGNDYTINLCRGLQEIIKDLTLVVPKNRNVELSSRVKVKYWAPSKDFKINKLKKVVDYFIYLFHMLFLISSNKKCIVHFQFFRRKLDIYFLMLLSVLGAKIVYTAHNVLPHETKRFDKFRAKILYKASSSIIVHSDFIKRKLLKEFPFCNSKIHIVPHGNFDNYLPEETLTKKEARSHFGISLTENVILFFGYIREYKGLDFLLDAFELAAGKDDKLKLVIAGAPFNEELGNKYKDKILKSNFRDRIINHFNFIPSENIHLYFQSSDIVILPYKSIDHSGIIHLAYSFSKPVIATNVGDFSEVIEHNKSGKILEKNSVSDLAELILELCSDDDLEKMGKYAKYLSENKYSWENVCKKTLKVYNTLIN